MISVFVFVSFCFVRQGEGRKKNGMSNVALSTTNLFMSAYGIEDSQNKLAAPPVSTKIEGVSDADLAQGLPTLSGEEQCFLAMHVDLLKKTGYDKMKGRVLVVFDLAIALWSKLSLGAKIVFVIVCLVVGIFLIIPFFNMLLAVLTDIQAMVHILCLLAFALVVFIASWYM